MLEAPAKVKQPLPVRQKIKWTFLRPPKWHNIYSLQNSCGKCLETYWTEQKVVTAKSWIPWLLIVNHRWCLRIACNIKATCSTVCLFPWQLGLLFQICISYGDIRILLFENNSTISINFCSSDVTIDEKFFVVFFSKIIKSHLYS